MISPPSGVSVASSVSENAGARAFTLSMSANYQFALKAASRDTGASRDMTISVSGELGYTDAAGNVVVSENEVLLNIVNVKCLVII